MIENKRPSIHNQKQQSQKHQKISLGCTFKSGWKMCRVTASDFFMNIQNVKKIFVKRKKMGANFSIRSAVWRDFMSVQMNFVRPLFESCF
jgi:hypothetical protein